MRMPRTTFLFSPDRLSRFERLAATRSLPFVKSTDEHGYTDVHVDWYTYSIDFGIDSMIDLYRQVEGLFA